jgi:predicted ATPase
MEKIQIQGYKSIKDLSLGLRPINILIGANGSGKSNFLSFFEFLKNLYIQNLKSYVALRGATDKFLHKGNKVTKEIRSKLDFGEDQYSFTLDEGLSGFLFTKEELWHDNKPTDIASLTEESNLKNSDDYRAKHIRRCLDGFIKYHFHDTSLNSPFSKTSNIQNDRFRLYSKGENIAAYLYNIKENYFQSYNLIVRTIQSVAPYFDDFYLQPMENNLIQLYWTSKYDETIYGVSDLSDGTIRFIALCTLFLQPQLPDTIIIDEPELGLHPFAIAKLSGIIKSAAEKGCQVIIATQSADLIKYFSAEDIITVDSINGESHFERLDSSKLQLWLDNYYSLGDLWRQNIITTAQPNF